MLMTVELINVHAAVYVEHGSMKALRHQRPNLHELIK
jgi:hypothetical protein